MMGTSEFAAAIGATPRQVIHWTENRILVCLPGTDRKGTGNSRIYDLSEVPYGRVVRDLNLLGIDVGRLQRIVAACRAGALDDVVRWIAMAPKAVTDWGSDHA